MSRTAVVDDIAFSCPTIDDPILQLEDIRGINESLRKTAYDYADKADELEKRVDELEDENHDLQVQVNDLERENESLRDELAGLQERLALV